MIILQFEIINCIHIQFSTQLSALPDDLVTLTEDKMGFIMMECGFEGVSFKVKYFTFSFDVILVMVPGGTWQFIGPQPT